MVESPTIPSYLWGEVLLSAIYIANRISIKIKVDGKEIWQIPYEAFFDDIEPGKDNKLDISHLRTIGCKCFVHIEPETRLKLEKLKARAWEGVLVGFRGNYIYRVFNPAKNTIVETIYVVFHEENGELLTRTRLPGAFRKDRKKEEFDLIMAA